MLIVADSSALIALATCDGLDVLLKVYNDVKVPQAVYLEVTESDKPQAAVLESFLSDRVVEVDSSYWVLAAGTLGQGEIEAMVLYKQLSADALLIDDHRAIEKVAPYVQNLRHSSIHYGEALLSKVLSLANEQ
jgi:predicted nucleic acid-binding protein